MRAQSKEKMSIEYGTSFPENAVAFYLNQIVELEQNVRLPWLKGYELDIFIESLNIAIEYDGEHFHKTKYQKDMEKDRLCSVNGVELIRIREEGLDDLKGSVCFQVNPKKSKSLDRAISKVLVYVCNKGRIAHPTIDVDITRDSLAIQNYFITTSKKRSFLEKCPEESKEWNYNRNGNLLPENYAYTSKFKVWWICTKGHEWMAPIYSRADGNGCPYCTNRKVLVGFNDLASKDSKVAAEWDYEKNHPKTPDQVVYGSNTVYWWRCSEGHQWRAAVYSRVNGDGCPYCAGLLAIPGVNDLLTLNEPLAKEWDYEKNGSLTPRDVMPYTNRKVWWIGSCGHSWMATIASRTAGNGCPYCSNSLVLSGFNDLATTHPKLGAEWDETKNGLPANQVIAGSNKKAWWIGSCGHSFQSRIIDRTYHNYQCPYCSSKALLPGFNDLLTRNPSLAKEWDYEKNYPLRPEDVMPNSNKKVWWRCKEGHSWQAPPYSRNGNSRGCPYCSHEKVLPGVNDLLTLNPKLAKEWDYEKNYPLRPEDVMPHSNKKVWWICPNGHSYNSVINSRNGQGTGCAYCSHKKLLPGFNDLATTHPDLAVEWDYTKNEGLNPNEIISSRKKIWWICSNGHSYDSLISNRLKGSGCPQCFRNRHRNNK